MISICIIGQTAIIIKKQIEYQRDHLAFRIDNRNPIQEPNGNAVSTRCFNNQRWNQYICSNSGTILLVLVIFLISINFKFYMLNYSNLNEHEKLILQNLVFVGSILNLGIPLYMYAKNNKLLKHLTHEIMHLTN